MKGRVVAVDTLPDGREIAALMVDGRIEDLLIDPPAVLGPVQPGAIFRAVVDRPLKGQGGVMVRLGDGQTGFLREAKGLSPGSELLVQVNTVAEKGKAAPVTTRILFKSRYAIVTPGKPGRNISRSIKDEAERDRLAEIANDAMMDAPVGLGLIVRSAADGVDDAAIADDIAQMVSLAQQVAEHGTAPELLVEALGAGELAWRDWADPDPDEVRIRPDSFEELGLWDQVDQLQQIDVPLGVSAWMSVEPTRALVAVDINTGGNTSPAAGLKANIAALRDLPRQLRLRGLGGQIVVDLAPFPKKERQVLEQTLRAALRKDSVETTLAGWTPLGHMELQRKRERRPLSEVLIK